MITQPTMQRGLPNNNQCGKLKCNSLNRVAFFIISNKTEMKTNFLPIVANLCLICSECGKSINNVNKIGALK